MIAHAASTVEENVNSTPMNAKWLSELWRYRELAYFFAWRDVKVRYKQAALGAAWAVLQPLQSKGRLDGSLRWRNEVPAVAAG
jgi:hypothetical protein